MFGFTISSNRRHPVGEPPTYEVTGGGCEATSFETLSDARLFAERETAKYQNGRLLPFVPTHAILWQSWRTPVPRRVIPVRMVESKEVRAISVPIALYKEDEWEPCIIPEWTYSSLIDRVFLDGIMMSTAWFLWTYDRVMGVFGYFVARDQRDHARFVLTN